MKRAPLLSVLFALVLALVSSGCGETIRPAAAKVNGITISQEDLDAELEAIASNQTYVGTVEQGGFEVRGQGDGTLSNAFVGRVLTRQIFLALVHAEFVRKNLSVDQADLDAAKQQVAQSVGSDEVFSQFPEDYQQTLLRRNAEVAKLQQALSGAQEVTEEAVRKFFDENQAEFPEQTCVSHILFSVPAAGGQIDQAATAAQIGPLTQAALAARAEILAGGDFAAIAVERSADPGSKDQGGDLGCDGPGRFFPEFETAMEALPVGELSAPVQTQVRVHLIKVTERKRPTLEEVAPQIEKRLQDEGASEFSDFLEEAVEDARISVNPRYGRFDRTGQSPGVVPPGAPTTTAPGDPPPGTGADIPDPLQP